MTGTSLGPYQIVAKLGEGGMGEVYRATDTKLKRQVAIKILPASVAADHDRLVRFRREAEVLASLNHPNIAAIYGLEEGQEGREGQEGQEGQEGREGQNGTNLTRPRVPISRPPKYSPRLSAPRQTSESSRSPPSSTAASTSCAGSPLEDIACRWAIPARLTRKRSPP